MMTHPDHRARAASTQRTIGLAMLGSALALGACAALTAAGLLPMDEAARPWVAAGVGIAAALDVAMAIYFLRKSSQS